MSFLRDNSEFKLDVNATDNEGRTVGMHLAMKGCYSFLSHNTKDNFGVFRSTMTEGLSTFVNLKKVGYKINFVNEQKESALSMALDHMYESTDLDKFETYVRTIISLIFVGCDFNTRIDQDGNTPLMAFLLLNDYASFNHISEKCGHVNFSIRNKNGESLTSLYLKNKTNRLRKIDNWNLAKFDIDYVDPTNRNNVLMLSAITKPSLINEIIEKKPDLLHEINHKGENALIIACKANNYESVKNLLNHPIHNNINSQDAKGNTALHYAIECRNPLIVQKLIENNANKELKNFKDQSPYDLAMELGDKVILKAFKCELTTEDIINRKKNDPSKALEDIEEYLFPSTSITKYRDTVVTEDMITTAANIYSKAESQKKEYYYQNDHPRRHYHHMYGPNPLFPHNPNIINGILNEIF